MAKTLSQILMGIPAIFRLANACMKPNIILFGQFGVPLHSNNIFTYRCKFPPFIILFEEADLLLHSILYIDMHVTPGENFLLSHCICTTYL